jgi:2-oxoglutarate ferredoxin oxidoreductase subunit alpha
MQLAFHLADKYRVLVLVLSDFTIGRMAEPVELSRLDLDPVPEKDWALKGIAAKGGRRDVITSGHRPMFELYGLGIPDIFTHYQKKYAKIVESETRYGTYLNDDAQLLLVAYGSAARIAEGAVKLARADGLRVGLLRLITLWPFPKKALQELALQAGKVLVVEDSQGQLLEDVECTVQGKVPVHLLGIWARHDPSPSGMIHPERVLQEVKSLL